MMCGTLKYTHRKITSYVAVDIIVYVSIIPSSYTYIGVYYYIHILYIVHTPTFYSDSVPVSYFTCYSSLQYRYLLLYYTTYAFILSFSFTSSIPSLFFLVLSLFLSSFNTIYYTAIFIMHL